MGWDGARMGWDGMGHSEGESLGMGGEKRLGRKGPPQSGDQWGSLTSKSVIEEAPLTTLVTGPERQKQCWAKGP